MPVDNGADAAVAGHLGSTAVLAVDIGGTKLAVAVVDSAGGVAGLRIEPTRRQEGPGAIARRLIAMGHAALAEGGDVHPSAVGISSGGPLVAASGVLLAPLHLPDWERIEIGPMLSAEFGVPFVLENDATASALAEYRFGCGRGIQTLLYLTISTGIGGGAVVDGRLYTGAAGNGGEFGHVAVVRDGRLCACGRRGCIEAYASGTSIAARAAEAVADGVSTSLAPLPTIRAEDVVAAAARGDAFARALWDETLDLMASAVTDLVNVFEPNVVALGGGVARAGQELLERVRAGVARDAMAPAAGAVSIQLAALGDLVGVVGAGAIALEKVRSNASDRDSIPACRVPDLGDAG